MATPVEQIKDRLSITDVVSSYVQLQKAGKNFKAKSPFTNEKTPSFFVSPDRGMYYCFSSSKGGDIFTFIEEMEGVDFKGALKILAERAGVELKPESREVRTEREQLYAILEEATLFFQKKLTGNEEAKHYLEDRGVTGETTTAWRIGYAPDAWRDLKEHLLQKNFDEKLILRSGLIKEAGGGKSPYDVFRNRVMFPIADSSGRIVAFSGRALSTDPATPKYVNSPETELFQKSHILFGYHKAKQGIRTYDFSLIVEGQFDLVMAHQVGYTNAVAISGTALSEHHAELLGRLSNRIVLAYDADSAGVGSVKRSAEILLKRGMDVKVAGIEPGNDPADLAQKDPKLLKTAIGKATHVIEYLIAVIKRDAKDDRAFRLRVRDEVTPFILKIPSKIDQEHFESVIAEAIGTTQDAVHHDAERFREEEAKTPKAPPEHAETSDEAAEEGNREEIAGEEREKDLLLYLGALLLWQESLPKPTIDAGILRAHLKEILGEEALSELLDTPKEEQNKVLFEVEGRYNEEEEGGSDTTLQNEVSDLLYELSMKRLKRELGEAKEALMSAEKEGDQKKAEMLLKSLGDIQKKLSDLHTNNPFSQRND